MINRVCLIGRLTRDPELRRTNSGMGVTSFTVAFDNRTKNPDGSKSTSFISCTAWNKTAEYVCNYLKKGSLVSIDGRLQERKYQRQDGTNASVVEIIVENIGSLSSRPQNGSQPSSVGTGVANDDYSSDDSNVQDILGTDLADDDLPF